MFLKVILISLTTLQITPDGRLMVGSADPSPVYDFTRSCKCNRSVGLFTFTVHFSWFNARVGDLEREREREREREIARDRERERFKKSRGVPSPTTSSCRPVVPVDGGVWKAQTLMLLGFLIELFSPRGSKSERLLSLKIGSLLLLSGHSSLSSSANSMSESGFEWNSSANCHNTLLEFGLGVVET